MMDFRHSKWLSFISERLRIARNLIKEKGVLVISIGYHEVNNPHDFMPRIV